MIFKVKDVELTLEDVRSSAPPTRRELSAMFRLLNLLIGSGVPLVEAHDAIAGVISNNWIFALLAGANKCIRNGYGDTDSIVDVLKEIQGDDPIQDEVLEKVIPSCFAQVSARLDELSKLKANSDSLGLIRGMKEFDSRLNAYRDIAASLEFGPSQYDTREVLGFSPELISFCSELGAYIDDGLPILRSLRIVHNGGFFDEMNIPNVCDKIMEGATFSEALAQTPGELSSEKFVQFIWIGEVTGACEIILNGVSIEALIKRKEITKVS